MRDPDSTRDERLFDVLAQCIDDSPSGTASLESLVHDHPEFADELRDYFQMRQGVEALTDPFRIARSQLSHTTDTNAFEAVHDTKRFDESSLPRFQNYECTGLIDGGGMGVVYEARDLRLDRVVAIKTIRGHATATAEDIARFQKEAQRVAQLNHPSIVPIYEVGVEVEDDQALHFFTMRLMTGGSLADRLKQGRLDSQTAVRILTETGRGLHYAHQHGIIHRDVKPGNILFDEGEKAFVADFGLAKRIENPAAPTLESLGEIATTETDKDTNSASNSIESRAALVGTPMYMAPEQIHRDGELTTAVDIHGLGVVMYEMLTGKPPFQAANAYQTLMEVVRTQPQSLREKVGAIDRDLEAICLKCLAKEPRDRYGSAEAFADDLDRWTRREPILARRSLPWERVAKWVRRSPALAATSAVALLAIVFSIFSLWQSKEAIRNEQTQTQNALDDQTTTLKELQATRKREQRMAYLQSIALAEREWSEGNADGSKQVLAESPKQLRGWEWHYIQQRENAHKQSVAIPFEAGVIVQHPTRDECYVGGGSTGFDGQLVQLDENLSATTLENSHTDAVTSMAFSPDGRLLVSGDRGGEVHIRNLVEGSSQTSVIQTGSPVREVASQHDVASSQDVASLSAKKIATATADGIVRLWEQGQGSKSEESASMVGHKGDVWSIAFHPNGTTLASSGSDATIRLWDVESGKAKQVLLGHSELVRHVSFSPDGKQVLSSSHDGTARIWRLKPGSEVSRFRHPAFVTHALFAPHDHIITACVDGIIRVWDARAGTLKKSLRGHTDSIWSFCLSADGEEIVSISEDGTAKRWRWSDTVKLGVAEGGNDWLSAVAMDEQGELVVGHSSNKRLILWRNGDLVSIDEVTIEDETQIDISANLQVVCGYNANILGPGKWKSTEQLVQDVSARQVSIDGTGKRVATSDGYESISLWDRESGSLIRQWKFPKRTATLELSRDGKQLAAITQPEASLPSATSRNASQNTVHLWNCDTGDLLHSFDTTGNRLHFSPSGKLLTVLENHEQIDVRDTSTGKIAFSIRCERAPITAIAFSRDESRVFVGHEDGLVALWDTVTQRRILTLGELDGRVTDLALRNDGTLIGLSMLGTMRQWAASAGM